MKKKEEFLVHLRHLRPFVAHENAIRHFGPYLHQFHRALRSEKRERRQLRHTHRLPSFSVGHII